jgi:hypothetical protein
LAAFALNIWEGNAQENRTMEESLLALSYDDGHGATDDSWKKDKQPGFADAALLCRVRGMEIRYKATEGLARRGAAAIGKRLGVLAEMMDEEQQMRNFRIRYSGGSEITDDVAVASTLTSALRAVSELHRRRPEVDISRLMPLVQKLRQSSNPFVRNEAERTTAALNAK